MQNKKKKSKYSKIFPYAESSFRLLCSDPNYSQWQTTGIRKPPFKRLSLLPLSSVNDFCVCVWERVRERKRKKEAELLAFVMF